MDIEYFDAGVSVEWYSRESLMYRNGKYEVQIVFDEYKEGWFKTGREILSDEISRWESHPDDVSNKIDNETKAELIDKARIYFKKRKINTRVV